MKKWTQQDTTAHRGIAKIYRVVTDMGYIWRPTANSDVGLDGEIELVEDRAATAKIIKVQVKSGASYFRREDQRSFDRNRGVVVDIARCARQAVEIREDEPADAVQFRGVRPAFCRVL